MNLYDELGVQKGASQADIKRAYRRKARHKHPDHGGNGNEFAKMAQAYKVLSNPQLRSDYDRTGRVDDKPDTHAQAIQVVNTTFMQVLSGCDVVNDDVIGLTRNAIKTQLSKIKENQAQAHRNLKLVEQVRERLRHPGDCPPYLEGVVEEAAKQHRAAIQNCEAGKAVMEKALKILKNYGYDHDNPIVFTYSIGASASTGTW